MRVIDGKSSNHVIARRRTIEKRQALIVDISSWVSAKAGYSVMIDMEFCCTGSNKGREQKLNLEHFVMVV